MPRFPDNTPTITCGPKSTTYHIDNLWIDPGVTALVAFVTPDTFNQVGRPPAEPAFGFLESYSIFGWTPGGGAVLLTAISFNGVAYHYISSDIIGPAGKSRITRGVMKEYPAVPYLTYELLNSNPILGITCRGHITLRATSL